MIYLVDVNVLSEATKPAPNPRVVEWLRAHQGDLVEALALEQEQGGARHFARGAGQFYTGPKQWLDLRALGICLERKMGRECRALAPS